MIQPPLVAIPQTVKDFEEVTKSMVDWPLKDVLAAAVMAAKESLVYFQNSTAWAEYNRIQRTLPENCWPAVRPVFPGNAEFGMMFATFLSELLAIRGRELLAETRRAGKAFTASGGKDEKAIETVRLMAQLEETKTKSLRMSVTCNELITLLHLDKAPVPSLIVKEADQVLAKAAAH